MFQMQLEFVSCNIPHRHHTTPHFHSVIKHLLQTEEFLVKELRLFLDSFCQPILEEGVVVYETLSLVLDDNIRPLFNHHTQMVSDLNECSISCTPQGIFNKYCLVLSHSMSALRSIIHHVKNYEEILMMFHSTEQSSRTLKEMRESVERTSWGFFTVSSCLLLLVEIIPYYRNTLGTLRMCVERNVEDIALKQGLNVVDSLWSEVSSFF